MEDIRGYLEKLQVQTAECEMIRDLATDPKKRELFTRLAEHFKTLAGELEGALLRHDDALPDEETQESPSERNELEELSGLTGNPSSHAPPHR